MALDGLFLNLTLKEIESRLIGARVQKIYMPGGGRVVLNMRAEGESVRLLLCGDGAFPRIHITQESFENPASPPMFCMLLRGKLTGARLRAVRQTGLDRAAELEFEGTDELLQPAVFFLIVEVMGRHSNIVLANRDRMIIDCLKRIPLSVSSVRQLLPGLPFEFLPKRNRLSLLEKDTGQCAEAVFSHPGESLSKSVLETLEGFSPGTAEETAFFASGDNSLQKSELKAEAKEQLIIFLARLQNTLREKKEQNEYWAVFENGVPRDFFFFRPKRFSGSAVELRKFLSPSELLDEFCREKLRAANAAGFGIELKKIVESALARLRRKLVAQREELVLCSEREEFKKNGELLFANLHLLKKGDSKVILTDYFAEPPAEVTIELDKRLTPSQNAQQYYKMYNKKAAAEKALKRLIEEALAEEEYLESVLDAISRVESSAETEEIRDELASAGHIRKSSGKKHAAKNNARAKVEFGSAPPVDGFEIHFGRNNRQNDRLTFKTAAKNDLWFHARNIPGSHVILRTSGNSPTEAAIFAAASVAAKNSKAAASGKVPVDFCEVRFVKKPAGAPPGKVIYDRFKTIVASSD